MPAPTQNSPRFVFAYTVCLYVIGVLSLMMIFSHQMLLTIMQESDGDVLLTAVLRFLQIIEAIIFSSALVVAILRSKNSPLAKPTTAALSILLVLWVPFGTIAFIWWLGWIRLRERNSPKADTLPY